MSPTSVVIDTRDTVKKLREHLGALDALTARFLVLQILEDIFDCLHNAKTFQRELRALVQDIESGKYKRQYPKQNGTLSALVHEVAVVSFEQLKAAGAYLPDGLLPYYYYPVSDPHFHDVFLLKIHELQSSD